MPAALPKPTHLRTPPGVIAGIIAVSAAASALICWLVYFHTPTDVAGTHLRSLPLVNAVLNALATIALVTGFARSAQRRILHHRASMFAAFFFSSIFLVSLPGQLHPARRDAFAHRSHRSPWNTYAFVLFATHIPLAIVALPHDSDHVLPLADRPLPRAQEARALDVSHLAVCLRQRRLRLFLQAVIHR